MEGQSFLTRRYYINPEGLWTILHAVSVPTTTYPYNILVKFDKFNILHLNMASFIINSFSQQPSFKYSQPRFAS